MLKQSHCHLLWHSADRNLGGKPQQLQKEDYLVRKEMQEAGVWLYFFRDVWRKTSPYLELFSQMETAGFVRKDLYLGYTAGSRLASN